MPRSLAYKRAFAKTNTAALRRGGCQLLFCVQLVLSGVDVQFEQGIANFIPVGVWIL